MKLTLEPLSAAHLPDLTALWSDREVIRYTNVPSPCGAAESARRLEILLDCQRRLPRPLLFALRGEVGFCGVAGCPPLEGKMDAFGLFYQLLPAF